MIKLGKRVIVRVESELVNEIKEKIPELKGLTYAGVVDYLLRKALKEGQGK